MDNEENIVYVGNRNVTIICGFEDIVSEKKGIIKIMPSGSVLLFPYHETDHPLCFPFLLNDRNIISNELLYDTLIQRYKDDSYLGFKFWSGAYYLYGEYNKKFTDKLMDTGFQLFMEITEKRHRSFDKGNSHEK